MSFKYNKYDEHRDRTSLGKLQSKYWTTKQLVIKKLGREEDEFVIASDSDVDAKLELLYAIKRSCFELLRIMERYQRNVILLSHEETEMARFLKDYAQMDKTRAGKIMSSVSKVLAYTAQQRLTLRQPLLRLHNEIETFHFRAVTDTLSTVKRMETARTEYRGSILWLKDASVQLDPEKQLEKFRRVQSEVKTNKAEYDRLKSDVLQKIDLLTASRCNMYSHVLAAYQKALLVFWAKTSKTMTAIAESFKGYQYYEFTVIKDLAEPSRLLAERNSTSSNNNKKKEEKKPIDTDEKLIDVNETNNQSTTLENSVQKEENADPTESFNTLIDITDSQLDDQLIELEKLTTIDKTSTTNNNNNTKPMSNTSDSNDNFQELLNLSIDEEKLLSDFLSPLPSETNNINSDLQNLNQTNIFNGNWSSNFGNQQVPTSSIPNNSNNTFLPSTLLNELLTSNPKPTKTNSPTNAKGKSTTDKSNWLNLFAELDPLQNPDAIGKSSTDETDRNC